MPNRIESSRPTLKGHTAKSLKRELEGGRTRFAVCSYLPYRLVTVNVLRVEGGKAVVTCRAGEVVRRPSEFVNLDQANEILGFRNFR